MNTDTTALPTPTAGLLCAVNAAAWVEKTTTMPTGYLLITHPPARRRNEDPETIERSMRGLGVALGGLRPTFEKVKHTGNRIAMLGGTSTRALLMLDHTPAVLRLPPAPADWIRLVADGGPVCLIMALTPVPPLADHQKVSAYASAVVAHDRALMGVTGVTDARSWSRPQTEQPVTPPVHPADDEMPRRKFVTSAGGITRLLEGRGDADTTRI
ncbi:hypothetical protein ACFY2W_08330 [Streptomyces sp. NPDC001262]|uniref:hypothetical protein n=1 Tax=Streptomyces sp. NPDC001262 TaxID=3364552 RepID=UPI0036B4DFE4